jgi:hypothetical protein
VSSFHIYNTNSPILASAREDGTEYTVAGEVVSKNVFDAYVSAWNAQYIASLNKNYGEDLIDVTTIRGDKKNHSQTVDQASVEGKSSNKYNTDLENGVIYYDGRMFVEAKETVENTTEEKIDDSAITVEMVWERAEEIALYKKLTTRDMCTVSFADLGKGTKQVLHEEAFKELFLEQQYSWKKCQGMKS